jgi:proteasome lid subunit RPN8/RPN11
MSFSILTLARAALGKPPRLVCSSAIWRNGTEELRRRTGGRKESGAFLLGRPIRGGHRIEAFLFYDDVDPTCFRNGIVEFDGRKFGIVWQRCRDLGLTVAADVHVHPGGYGQSASDQHNPMIAECGHLALILPHFAGRRPEPGRIGMYEYLGGRRWSDHSHKGRSFFHVGWWPQ